MAYNAYKIRRREYGTSDPADKIGRREFGCTYPANEIGRHGYGTADLANKIGRREYEYDQVPILIEYSLLSFRMLELARCKA